LRTSVLQFVEHITSILGKAEPIASVRFQHESVSSFVIHFAGGRAFIDPAICYDLTPRLVDLLHALHLALGDRLTMGRPGGAV